MSDETFDYEIDQVMQKVLALEKELKAMKDLKDTATLQSKSGRFQITLFIEDSGGFFAQLHVKMDDGSYKPSGAKRIGQAQRDPRSNIWSIN